MGKEDVVLEDQADPAALGGDVDAGIAVVENLLVK